jgi:hypothetical protein
VYINDIKFILKTSIVGGRKDRREIKIGIVVKCNKFLVEEDSAFSSWRTVG